MENQADIVTRIRLFEAEQEIKKELNEKIERVDEKVDQLRDIVLPLVESSNQTAANTSRIAQSMDSFMERQYTANDNFSNKLSLHDVVLAELGVNYRAQTEHKKASATVIVGVLGLFGVIISGIFAVAPLLFR